MAPLAQLWTIVTDVLYSLSVSSFSDYGSNQKPIGNKHNVYDNGLVPSLQHPIFKPPGSNIHGFHCTYPNMPGWKPCLTDTDKSCWLISGDGKSRFDIHTDYETMVPDGVDRYYTLNVTDSEINADGLWFNEAKLFNNTYPGPLIEACWGDRVHIKVVNKMKLNGTSVHWHGIRQFETTQFDGVNGVTQCPIAPEDYVWYNWTVTQYGSSWYHSHYSVQYADGTHAPITLHGPTSANFDEAIAPLIMTDWYHNSAFQVEYTFPVAYYRSILLNGAGNITRFNGTTQHDKIPEIYEVVFNETAPNPRTGARRYLLRLINSAFDAGFVFSIDNHILQVIETDFVPIEPYTTNSVLVAIGQRYMIIVEAQPTGDSQQNPVQDDGNYWIRTWVAQNCSNGDQGISGYERTGIVRYNKDSKLDPTSNAWPGISLLCVNEDYSRVHPVVKWTVGPASNGADGEEFNVTRVLTEQQFATAFLSFENSHGDHVTPLQVNYDNPTFLNMGNVPTNWPVNWMVVPEDYTSTSWVYLALSIGHQGNNTSPHPIHLHGHDFAILNISDNKYNPETVELNFHNPPRRDVVLLPNNGSVVIAFKSDNPGVWLMHCHIAFHASGGLALQIMERQGSANKLWPPGNSSALTEAQRICGNWQSWAYDCKNQWPGEVVEIGENGKKTSHYPACELATNIQNDSGI